MYEAQSQPHTYFGSVSAFVSDSAQFFLGTDTLRQSFHTLFQDPHASTGEKVKAAGVGLMTLGMDGVTIASTLIGDPEVGETAQATEEALLAADEAGHAAAATTEAATEAANETITAASEGGGYGGVNTTLYRAIDETEYDSVERSGFRSYGHSPSQGGKYFAYTRDGATQFAQSAFNTGHVWSITSAEVPQSAIDHALAAGTDHAYEFYDVGGANASVWFSDGKLDELIYPKYEPYPSA